MSVPRRCSRDGGQHGVGVVRVGLVGEVEPGDHPVQQPASEDRHVDVRRLRLAVCRRHDAGLDGADGPLAVRPRRGTGRSRGSRRRLQRPAARVVGMVEAAVARRPARSRPGRPGAARPHRRRPAAQPDRARCALGHDVGTVVPDEGDVQERADGLRRGERQSRHASAPGSSNGVAAEPRSTMSNTKPSAHVGSRRVEVEATDQSLPRRRVGDRVEDRVVGEQRVVREVHLRDESLGECPTEQREMDVRRTPGVVVVAPRIGARLDRRERDSDPRCRSARGRDPVKLGSSGAGHWSATCR